MTERCQGCGVILQDQDPKALGYVKDLSQPLCQRCFRIRNYGDVTIDMKQGIDNAQTLQAIEKTDAAVFWVVDLFAFEAGMIPGLNRKLPGKDVVLVLTKRDVLPDTLSDEKVESFVRNRLEEEGIQVQDIVLTGGMRKNGPEARESLRRLHAAMDRWRKGRDVVFMGTANAGKSTLLNQLTKGNLTVSRNPGTTLDLVPVEADGFTIYDTPGVENPHSVLSYLDGKDLKTVIPTGPIKPVAIQVFEDQSIAAGGLARLDVKTKDKCTVVANFAQSLPIHRGKQANADQLWKDHFGGLLSPVIPQKMRTWQAPKLTEGEKLDVDIAGLGWFCISGKPESISIRVPESIHVTFRKAMI